MRASASVAGVPPLSPPDPPLTDGVVTLRGFRDTDAGAIEVMMEDAEIARWTRAPSPYRLRDAVEWLSTHATLMRRRSEMPLAIVDAEDEELLGSISLRLGADARGEFGYAVARWARGQGFGTRALRLYARYAFDALRLERLEVFIRPENEASLALAEAVGFQEEGLLRSHAVVRDRRVDMVVLGMLPGELIEE